MTSWRNKPRRTLWATAIRTTEFPALAKAMADDGVTFSLEDKGNGYVWRVADYELPTKSVREKWELSDHQMRRFIAWLLENDSELI